KKTRKPRMEGGETNLKLKHILISFFTILLATFITPNFALAAEKDTATNIEEDNNQQNIQLTSEPESDIEQHATVTTDKTNGNNEDRNKDEDEHIEDFEQEITDEEQKTDANNP